MSLPASSLSLSLSLSHFLFWLQQQQQQQQQEIGSCREAAQVTTTYRDLIMSPHPLLMHERICFSLVGCSQVELDQLQQDLVGGHKKRLLDLALLVSYPPSSVNPLAEASQRAVLGFLRLTPALACSPSGSSHPTVWKGILPLLGRMTLLLFWGSDGRVLQQLMKAGPLLLKVGQPRDCINEALTMEEAMAIHPQVCLRHFFAVHARVRANRIAAHLSISTEVQLCRWQQQALQQLDSQGPGDILFVSDGRGCSGKTFLGQYLAAKAAAHSSVYYAKGDGASLPRRQLACDLLRLHPATLVLDYGPNIDPSAFDWALMAGLKAGAVPSCPDEDSLYDLVEGPPPKILVLTNRPLDHHLHRLPHLQMRILNLNHLRALHGLAMFAFTP